MEMASTTFNMSNSYQEQCQSMYLPPDRPYISRQRSNSLPVGLMSSINPEEAGMMFSAAERATARRRGNASVDTSVQTNGLSSNLAVPQHLNTSLDMAKPSRRRRITQVRDSLPIHHSRENSRALRDLDANQVNNGKPTSPSTDFLLKALPVSPISPTKRQVNTRSLKQYADGLYQFTQHALISTIPLIASPPQTPNIFEDELASPDIIPSHTQRPSLESKFSDWSVSTSDTGSRRSSVAVSTPPPVEQNSSLMSPGSFFAGFDATPHCNDANRQSGYASSETFDSPIHLPPLTPPSRIAKPETSKEEFSYFTNYDHYLGRDSEVDTASPDPPDNLEINLSPIEVADSPHTPPIVMRHRADTVVRAPFITRSFSGTPRTPFAHSTPTTPFQLSDSVPNWLVGTMC